VNSDETIEIDAVDISEKQLYLSNLKLQAAIELEATDAAKFLGYIQVDQLKSKQLFNRIKNSLPEKELLFWINNKKIFDKGPIHYGRYETYISHFAPVGRFLLGGRKNLMGLFDCRDTVQQKEYFDEFLKTRLLRILFKMMFHQRLYKNRGISEKGLIHIGEENVGTRFFNNFRSFCTNTPSRKNWYLQFMLFNQVLFEDALPEYLHVMEVGKLKESSRRLKFIKMSFTDIIEQSPSGHYNKFALSNISDWLTAKEVMLLIDLIARSSGPNAAGLIRYIHSSGIKPKEIHERIKLNPEFDLKLMQEDRFPFYNLVSFRITDNFDDTN